METFDEFRQLFLEKASGSNLRFLIQDTEVPAFCVGIMFEHLQGQVEPTVRFFCTSDSSDALDSTPNNIVSLPTVNVIPPVLYYAAGVLFTRITSWMRGETVLDQVPFNNSRYKTTLTYRDHRGE